MSHDRTRGLPVASAALIGLIFPHLLSGQDRLDDVKPAAKSPVSVEIAARLPAPGTVVPGSIAFAPDNRSVTYLFSESNSLARAAWRVDVSGGSPRVIARAPGGSGDTDASVSQEEALRRERQRLRETGITNLARAKSVDLAASTIGGDVYLIRAGADALDRLTTTPDAEVDPKPSPDGSKVAYVRGGELYAFDVAGRREVALSSRVAEGVSHGLAEFMAQEEMGRSTGYWWSADGRRIAYQEADERHIPAYSIVHQGDTSKSVESHRYPFPGEANARVRLGVVSAEGGSTTWLDLPVPADGDFYLARVDWEGPDHLLVQILDRDQKRLTLHRVDVASNTSRPLIEEVSETWVNLHNDLHAIESTGEIVWSSERTGFRRLELLDHDGKLIRALTDGVRAVDGIDRVDQRRREVWYSAPGASPLDRLIYRVSLDGGPPVAVADRPGTHRAVVSVDGEFYVDTFSDPSTPPVTRIFRRDGATVSTIDDAARSDPRVAGLHLAPPEFASFSGPDGITFEGAFYPPKERAEGRKAPLIVMLYGGPHVQYVSRNWSMTSDLTAQFLAGQGFAVWKMDNRGSSRRGLAFESAIHLRMGTVEVADQAAGVRFASKRWADLVDPDRVGVTGSSYGGYMTLRCLTEAPDVFRAGVSVAPVTDWDGYDTCYTERYMETPKANPGGYQASSAIRGADRLRGDLLIVHGMIDENVHFRHSARLVDALIALDRPFEFLPVPTERHSTRKESSRRYVLGRMAEFFGRTLGLVDRQSSP